MTLTASKSQPHIIWPPVRTGRTGPLRRLLTPLPECSDLRGLRPPKQDNPNLAPVGGGFGFIFYLDKMAWTSSNIVSKQKNLFKKGARACAGAGSCCWSTAILFARNPQAECFQAILRGPNANAFTGDVRSVNQYIIFIHRAVTPFFRRFLLKSPTIYGTF